MSCEFGIVGWAGFVGVAAQALGVLWIALFGPLIGAAVFALIQDGIYRLLVASGRLADENRPFFGILVFRGLILSLVVILSVTLILKQDTPLEKDPMLSEEQQRQIDRMKSGESPIAAGDEQAANGEGSDAAAARDRPAEVDDQSGEQTP